MTPIFCYLDKVTDYHIEYVLPNNINIYVDKDNSIDWDIFLSEISQYVSEHPMHIGSCKFLYRNYTFNIIKL